MMGLRHRAWILLALASSGCFSVSDLNPKTAATVANGPIVPGPREALVVFARASAWNEGGRLRIVDERRSVLADLDVDEHAVVAVSPGAHAFFAYEWSSGVEKAWCVGALRADVVGGRVYAVRAAQYPSMGPHPPWSSVADEDDFDCRRIELLRVAPMDREAFWRWTRTSSTRRAVVQRREQSIFIDAPWRSETALAKGSARMANGPAWSAAWSSLAPGDGEVAIP